MPDPLGKMVRVKPQYSLSLPADHDPDGRLDAFAAYYEPWPCQQGKVHRLGREVIRNGKRWQAMTEPMCLDCGEPAK